MQHTDNQKQMESAKSSSLYKFESFDKKLSITVVDPIDKIEFHQKLLTLTNIGTSTLIRALEKKGLQVKMSMKVKKTQENTILQIDVLVASQFLKPVQEVIYIKKSRDITESEVLRNAVGLISGKIKVLKENENSGPNVVRLGTSLQQQKLYNTGNNFQPIATLKLPKGKHILTLSLLAKPTNTILYLYFNQTQPMLPNYFYTQNAANFIPLLFRKVHVVNAVQETVTFNVYCVQSYPVAVRDVVATAQEVKM